MRGKSSIILFTFFLLCHSVSGSSLAQPQAQEKISSRYATISYQGEPLLRSFNKRIKLGSLDYLLKRRISGELSLQDQVSGKVDIIVERVETMLEMHPKNFRVDIIVVRSTDDVRALYKQKYRRDIEFLAFYSPSEKSIYISADEARSNILAHELAHAVIDQYFGVAAPVKIHELLAGYVSENFEE